MRSFEENLDVHIRARYKVLAVNTLEEKRCLECIESVVAAQNKKAEQKIKGEDKKKTTIVKKDLYAWSLSRGLVNISEKSADADIKDAGEVLQKIIETEGYAVYVLFDVDKWWDDNVLVERLLKDFASEASYKTIILITSMPTVPTNLSKVVTLLDFPYPGRELLKKTLENTIKGCPIPINLDEYQKEEIIMAGLGLTATEFEIVLQKSVAACRTFKAEELVKEKEQIIKKSGRLEFFHAQENMSSVGGQDVIKEYLNKLVGLHTEKAEAFGIERPKGIFLVGPAGTGKSLIAKAMSNKLGCPLLRMDMSKIKSKYVGESEQNIFEAIKLAEAISPSILWMDEIDKLIAGSLTALDSGVSAAILSHLLTWLAEHRKPVLTVVTCNRQESVPVELLNRFDKVYFVDLPTDIERAEILKIHLTKRKRDPNNYDIKKLVQQSKGYNGRELERCIKEGLIDAFSEGSELSTEHILKQIKAITPVSKQRPEEINGMRQWAKENALPASKGSETTEVVYTDATVEVDGSSNVDPNYS
ncbi:MAG: AAA family ATPase [Candidatus Blackburnbacteria bacterium]|nr:AAA family ATPase [Candidatus Blackburnbacteria bacterium]